MAEVACVGVGIEVRLLVGHFVGVTVGAKGRTAEGAYVGVGIEVGFLVGHFVGVTVGIKVGFCHPYL
jgi:hypothetical protein